MRRNHARAVAKTAFFLVSAAAAAALVPAGGCGGDGTGGGGGAGNTTVLHPDAPPLPGETECKVVQVVNIEIDDAQHVGTCTPVKYATNPPSGGNHWPQWAAFKKYSDPVPREMYVHDLEHGAIVLAYRCQGACPDVVAALGEVFDSLTDDACPGAPGPSARVILTPDPLLDTPIAAAAWGATYTATCIDVESLKAFAKANYAKAPEDFCTEGVDVTGVDPCAVQMDGGADGGEDAGSDGGAP